MAGLTPTDDPLLQNNSTLINKSLNMIRKIVSVLAGYSIFVVTSLALFKLSGHKPHSNPTNLFVSLTAVYGAAFSFLSGLAVQLVARTKNLNLNYILAFIIAGFATFSFFKSDGNHWTQVLAIFIFAPVSVLGGLFYYKRRDN